MIKKENILSFFFFSGSKSIVFFTPLAILWLFGDRYYVLVEQLFATSLLAWPVLALGMTSAYSYFFLERQDNNFVSFYYRYLLLILGGLTLVILSIQFVEHNSDSLRYMPFIVFLMCFSYFISAVHKCNSDVIRSSCFDTLPYFCFIFFLILSVWNDKFGLVLMLSILSIMLLYVFLLSQQKKVSTMEVDNTIPPTFSSADLTLYFSKGLHSFIVSWIAIAVVMFPRVFMADFASVEESKELYLALRFGTFFVLIYQFVQIKMYAKVFRISAENMLKVLVLYWFVISVLLIALILLGFTLPYYFAVLYTAMWVMVSMLELQVIRKGVQMAVVKGVLLLSPIMALLFFINEFYYFIAFSITLLSLYLFVQAYSVYKATFSLKIMVIPIISSVGLLYYA